MFAKLIYRQWKIFLKLNSIYLKYLLSKFISKPTRNKACKVKNCMLPISFFAKLTTSFKQYHYVFNINFEKNFPHIYLSHRVSHLQLRE